MAIQLTERENVLERVYSRIRQEGSLEGSTELAAYHFARFMEALGINPLESVHTQDTPARVTSMYQELLLGGEPFAYTTFASDSSGVVVMRDIPFVSFCAHHFLPYTGVAHVAYKPAAEIVGLSKLARTVATCAARPSVQEQLTAAVRDQLSDALQPLGVAVIIEARHTCMEYRGPKVQATTVTESATREDVLEHLRRIVY